jgi:hypothetical protein
MIIPPRRSVTRFFIPLIDVLILLFCIFLLMPYVKPADSDAASLSALPEPQTADLGQLRREVDSLRHERDRLAQERSHLLDGLAIRVLEIDPDTGRLFDYDPDRAEIASALDAQSLIDRHKRNVGERDVYFLILFPREITGYPLEKQVAAYSNWFKDVPHGFDNPASRGRHR